MQDQRALVDQLRALYALANRNGLYDAADYVRSVYEAAERREANADARAERSRQLQAKIQEIIDEQLERDRIKLG